MHARTSLIMVIGLPSDVFSARVSPTAASYIDIMGGFVFRLI